MENNINASNATNLEEWGLPEGVLNHYKKRKITKMFPWQADCLSMGSVLDGENLIYSAPTSAGKTLVAEILVAQTVFEKQKKALIILPFVSVVREKMFYFQEMFSESGIRVEGYMGGHTPKASFQQVHVGVCTIEKANSLLNRMLEEKTLSKLGIVVVDELHLLGDPYRGYLLELLLTKLKYMSSYGESIQLQIVGMSATLPNLNALAKWLDAQLFFTDFRPVPLSEHLKCGKLIMNKSLEPVGEVVELAGDDSEHVGHMCIETMAGNHSALIFCPTKAWCESLALKLAAYFHKLGCSAEAVTEGTPGWTLRKQLDLEKLKAVVDHLKVSPVGLDKDLAKTIPLGVAFHHAGLTLDERDIIEGSFRNGCIRILCATSTLSSGVNLPARRVIIRSPMSFGGVMDVMTYRQMIGRAGRMGVDTQGESILVCKPTEKVICQQLMNTGLKPIVSCLGSGHLSASLKRAVLEVIASKIATTAQQLTQYANATFLATTNQGKLEDPLTSCVDFLIDNDLIRLKDGGESYAPTPLGEACLASSLPPDEGLALFRELERARRCFVLDSDLHVVYQITPYTVSEQWGKIDWLKVLSMLEELSPSMRRVADLVGVEDAFLVKVVKGTVNTSNQDHRNKLSIHRRFYTALALHDLVNEVPLSEVAKKFDCNKGMMQQLQQNAATYAGMVAEFAKRLRWGTVELIVGQFQERLQFGVHSELCELMKLPSINGLRARALYNSGITTLSEVANSDNSSLEAALLNTTPFQSKGQAAGETNYEALQRAKQQTLWVTGRAGLSIQTAAEILIKEAREVLEIELGVCAKWGSEPVEYMVVSQISQRARKTTNSQCGTSQEKSSCSDDTIIEGKVDKEMHSIALESSEHKVKDLKTVIKCPTDSNTSDDDVVVLCDPMHDVNCASACEVEIPKSTVILCNPVQDGNSAAAFKGQAPKSTITDKSEVIPMQCGENYNMTDLGQMCFDTVCTWENAEENHSEKEEVTCPTVVNETIDGPEKDKSEYLSESLVLSLPNIEGSKKRDKIPYKNRFSADMFETSLRPKPCSTPLQEIKSASFNSPDLFNQSLTFDTQLERIIDSEQVAIFSEDLPSSPPKSDDLGYLSDTPAGQPESVSAIAMDTVGESFFAATSMKRKASPDVIQGSDDSLNEDVHKSRRNRKVGLFRTRSKRELKRIRIDKMDDSEDEIARTPIIHRTTPLKSAVSLCSSHLSKRMRSDIELIELELQEGVKECKSRIFGLAVQENIDWETMNVVDVCGNQLVFSSFCEELKQQTMLGLALGCRKKVQISKPKIGAKFRNSKKDDVEPDFCHFSHEDIIIDGFAVYWNLNNVFYVSCCSRLVSKEDLLSLLFGLFSSSNVVLQMMDAREQLRLLSLCSGVKLGCSIEDPSVAAWLLSTSGTENDMSSIQREYLPKAGSCMSVFGQIRGHSSPGLDTGSSVSAKFRACTEAFLVHHILPKQKDLLAEIGLLEVYKEVEMPILRILAEMEVEGLTMDEQSLKSIKSDLEACATGLERKAHLIAGRHFPLSSHDAVGKLLYTELCLGKSSIMTKRQKPSISKEALELLEAESKHPLPRIILQWRKVQAIINKTVCPLLQILPENKIRGNCQTLTVTGRISMREPNMQNIPKDFSLEMEEGKNISVCLRNIFVAARGHILLSADYCQIELRMLAHLSQDKVLMDNISASQDIFLSIAASLFSKEESEVNEYERQRAKQTCYGIIYGIGARSLAQQLDITEESALALMTTFKNTYNGVREFLQETIAACQRRGYVTTLSGRRRFLPAINSTVPAARNEAERQAVNTCVQGSAADLVKRAMVAIRNNTDSDVKLVLHLHDEVMYQVKLEKADETARRIKECMETACQLSIPVPVKVKSGPTWGQLWPHASLRS